MSCQEYYLDNVMAIVAIPVDDIPAESPSSPANSLRPSIPSAGFSPPLARAVTIGALPATEDGALVPIQMNTGKAKDGEGDSSADRLHTVSVTCEVDDRDMAPGTSGKSVLDHLLTLERTPSHLLLTFRGGARALVSATEDTYTCEVERDGAKTAVTFRIQNLMGVQFIV